MQLKDRIVFTFNKFYSNLIKDLKASNEDLRSTIKKNYKVIDKLSTEYCEFFLEGFSPETVKNVESLDESLVLKDIKVKDVLEKLGDSNVFWNYVYILTVVSSVYKELSTTDEKQCELLFNSVVSVLGTIQKNEDAQKAIDEILDDDIRQVLGKIKMVEEDPAPKSEEDPFADLFGKMGNSKICSLAKEISQGIDVSNINVEKPEDIFKMMDFTSSNNILGDIVKKVSSTIHDKISTGELKQEDLFGEAMSMMSMMNKGGGGFGDIAGMMGNMMNNPMMGDILKATKKGKANVKKDVFKKADVRERLRNKLDARKKSSE